MVTERGREVARLTPCDAGAYAEVARRFGASVPRRRLEEVAASLRAPSAPAGSTDAFLAEGARHHGLTVLAPSSA